MIVFILTVDPHETANCPQPLFRHDDVRLVRLDSSHHQAHHIQSTKNALILSVRLNEALDFFKPPNRGFRFTMLAEVINHALNIDVSIQGTTQDLALIFMVGPILMLARCPAIPPVATALTFHQRHNVGCFSASSATHQT
jgi:hypothetical protein